MNRQRGSRHGKLGPMVFAIVAALALTVTTASAQQEQPPAALTLRQAVAQAIQRSHDVTAARLRYEAAQRETAVSRSQFTPNVVAGSGAAYTNGFPLAAGGGAPALVSMTFNQTLLDPMARSDIRAAQQREEQMRLAFDGTRDAVITRVASSYLELLKVRRSRELLVSERAGAARILAYIRQRVDAGLELPIEITRAQLTAAKIEQGIARQENSADAVSDQLRVDLGLASDQSIDVVPGDLPAVAEPDANFVERAVQNSLDVKQAAAERQTSLVRLQGEQGSRWPTLSILGQYNVLAKFNNYDQFFNKFQRNNVIAGVQVRIPIFTSRSNPGIAAAQANFKAAQSAFDARRGEVSLDVRQKMRQRRESDAAREVARLELELAQQNTAVVQSQFDQGRATLRDLEAAQLEQNDKWLAFLDSDFARQQAQLAFMKVTGQVAQLAQ
jgi:outer membrane protein